MSGYSDVNVMEPSSDHEIQDKIGMSNNVQTKTEENAYQTVLNTNENQADLQIPTDNMSSLEDNTVVTSDHTMVINDALKCNNPIFIDILAKIKAFADKAEHEIEKSLLLDEGQIFYEFFNLIEKHEDNFTDEDILLITKALDFFNQTIRTVDAGDIFSTESIYFKKEIFYIFFNLINLGIIQKYLKNVSIPDRLKKLYRSSVSRILVVMCSASTDTNLGDLNEPQRPTNCIELLSSMLDYVRTDLDSSDLTATPLPFKASITRLLILNFLWNYSDTTIFIPDLIEAKCLEVMIFALQKICTTENVTYELQLQIISTIHNISRHDDGIKQLNALNAADTTKLFQNIITDTDLNTNCCMILALLSTPEQIKNDPIHMHSVLDTLLEMVYNASDSLNYRSKGSHISEPLIVFVKLFNDDRTLQYIMDYSQIELHTSSTTEFFINLLVHYRSSTTTNDDPLKQATCTALVNILWSISFQDKYKEELKNADIKFKELIQSLAKEKDDKIISNQYVPKYIENIQQAAEGLLFNIDELSNSIIERTCDVSTRLNNEQKLTIMISYSHEDIDFCKQLCNEILKKGYEIWIDFEFLKTGDLWEKIAVGMKQANVIVCLMSEDYCKSNSCRLEATYALDKLQTTKLIIPVFLQKPELPSWLVIRTVLLKYVRFRDLKQLEHDKLAELLDMIESSLPSAAPPTKITLQSDNIPSHCEPTPETMLKDNASTSHTSKTPPVHSEQATQAKLQNQDISSNSDLSIRTPTEQKSYQEKPIEQWNRNDIAQWFEHNEIIPELRDLCHFKDGYELLDYRKIFLGTEQLQYHLYFDEFSKHDGITAGKRPLLLHEFTKFSSALRRLQNSKK